MRGLRKETVQQAKNDANSLLRWRAAAKGGKARISVTNPPARRLRLSIRALAAALGPLLNREPHLVTGATFGRYPSYRQL